MFLFCCFVATVELTFFLWCCFSFSCFAWRTVASAVCLVCAVAVWAVYIVLVFRRGGQDWYLEAAAATAVLVMASVRLIITDEGSGFSLLKTLVKPSTTYDDLEFGSWQDFVRHFALTHTEQAKIKMLKASAFRPMHSECLLLVGTASESQAQQQTPSSRC